MFKQSLNNIISLRKKYSVAITTLVLMLSLYLIAINLFTGLNYNTNLKDLHHEYVNTLMLKHNSMISYLGFVTLIFGSILVITITKYISNLRAKEYSIYLIIAGVKKSTIYKQIFLENLFLFLFVTLLSVISFVILSYPLSYLIVSSIFGSNVKYLTFFIDFRIGSIFFKTIGILWALFSMFHMYNFSKLTVKELMIASRTSETKKADSKVRLSDIVKLSLSIIAMSSLIIIYAGLLQGSGGSYSLLVLPVFIVIGFIVNIVIFRYLIKIIFITITKSQKKYNGLNKYYHSLIITKSSTLSKILGSTASIIVVCISALVLLNNFSQKLSITKSPVVFKQDDNKTGIKIDSKYTKWGFEFKKSNKSFYIRENNLKSFLKEQTKISKSYNKSLKGGYKLQVGSNANKEKYKLEIDYIKGINSQKDNARIKNARDLTIETASLNAMMGIYNYSPGNTVKSLNNEKALTSFEKRKEDIQKRNDIYIVSNNIYSKINAKKEKVIAVLPKNENQEKEYNKLIRIKNSFTRYPYMKMANQSFNSLKLIIYIIPILGFITQISTLLFKFINSGWDNYKFTSLFLNLGFTKKQVSKIYFKETVTIFALPLLVGICEAILVEKTIIPQILKMILTGEEVSSQSLYFGIASVVIIFMFLGLLTYNQYKNISFKK